MQFLPTVSKIKRFKSFKRLAENKSVLTTIAKRYAEASGMDVTETVSEVNKYSTKFFSSGKRSKTNNDSKS